MSRPTHAEIAIDESNKPANPGPAVSTVDLDLGEKKFSADIAFAYASNIDYRVQDVSQSYDISCQHLKRLQKSCPIQPAIPIDELSNKPANPGPAVSTVDLDLVERKISADIAFAYASNIDYRVQDVSQSYDISCQHLKRLQKSCPIQPAIPIDELSNKPANPGPELSAVGLDLGESKISADLAFAYLSNIDYRVEDLSQSYDISCEYLKRLQKSCPKTP